jgi:DNA-binding NtrC family response regulator
LVLDVSAPDLRAGVDREVLMTHESAVPAPEIPASSLAPNQIVPLLIGSTVGEIERELVLQTLARYDGNRTHAARVLGVSVRTLRNKIRLYSADGIDVPAHSD